MLNQENINEYPKEAFIKLKHEKGISAKDFSEYIRSLDKEYAFFLKVNNLDKKIKPELEITKIKQGSIDIFLAPILMPGILPLLSNINIIFDFITHIKNHFQLLLERKTKDFSSQQLTNYEGMTNLTTNGNVTLNFIDNRNGAFLNMGSEIDSNISNIAKNALKEEQNKRISSIPEGTYHAVPFCWDSAKFKESKQFNYKGICENISAKPLNVIFASDEIQKYMTKDSHLGKPWQDLIYVVDVELCTVKGQQILKIIKIYENQTFFQENK